MRFGPGSNRNANTNFNLVRLFQAAGLLRFGTFERVQAAFRPAGTADLEVAVP